MTLQERIDLTRPRNLETAIDGAAIQIAYPGEYTDVASWQESITALCKRAGNVAEAARKAAAKKPDNPAAIGWQEIAREYQGMADYAAHFVKGGKR